MTREIVFSAEQIAAQDESVLRLRENARKNAESGIGFVITSRDVLNLADLFGVAISKQGRNFLNTRELDIPTSAELYAGFTRNDLSRLSHELVQRTENLALI